MAKIIWHRTGDELEFIPCHLGMFEYYVNQINFVNQNKFSLKRHAFPQEILSQLQQALDTCQNIGHGIPFEISDWEGDLLDQKYLNQLHREWVLTGTKHPKIILLLRALGKDQCFRNINIFIHAIERNWKFKFTNYNSDAFQTKNIFGNKILNFDRANIVMDFDNLGRSAWNKFMNRDCIIDNQDLNDYSMLSGAITLNLRRPLSLSPPIEYVEWCKQHEIPPVGRYLNIGNLIDLDKKLTSVRHIILKNINEQSNTFFFEFRS